MACEWDHHEEPKRKSKHCKNEVNELLDARIDVAKLAGDKNGTTIYGALSYQMVSKRATDKRVYRGLIQCDLRLGRDLAVLIEFL